MSRLTYQAREQLGWSDVTIAAWARWNGWTDGVWHGDACGCSDDRCIGYHHVDERDCGCLTALLQQRAEQLRDAVNNGASPVTIRAGKFGQCYPAERIAR